MSDLATYKRYAEKVRIFNGLEPEEVGDILRSGNTLDFWKGQTVFHEGNLGSNLFVVLHGGIGIYIKQQLIAKCRVGDAFGEMSILNRKPRNATAAALSDTKLFTLSESDIEKILKKQTAVRVLLNVIHVLSERLEKANVWIANHSEEN